MGNVFSSHELHRQQEIYRAKQVVNVAEAAGNDIAKTLRDYGVVPSIINELGIEVAPIVPKGKKTTTQQKLEGWAKDHIGDTIVGGKQIAEDTGLSYPTANNFIQARRDIFTRLKRGQYIVKDAEAERSSANK